ncbi:MAG TPA: DUF1800 domain-containing protein [Usitatibacter sp.]|jgi:uncharacterized protein (DUF1800 family)|nr:DUF1800 domain-containing protein [Usitatibacter sp.]
MSPLRFFLPVLLALAAVAARAAPLGYADARHLLNRTGFGATDADVREYAALTREEAVKRLLDGARREAATPAPAFVHEPIVPYREVREMDAEQRKAFRGTLVQQGLELRAWWIGEMLATPSPLTERMTLFWHNHFATSQRKVRYAQLMYAQNALLRREALGNFGTMLHAVARDPAMLVWLDNARSRREAPNENFAREVMELFTLGEGHYGERDVKEAARAFTGWSLEPATARFVYRPRWHDDGDKTVLGTTGPLDGDAVLDLLLARAETSEHIARKLWLEFVSPTPDAAEVARWARTFREMHYEIKPLMREVLLSSAFWAPANRGALVKSPVDLVVGTLHGFSIHPADLRPAAVALALFGQNLFAPPNVKGWAGGDAWIDSATLLGRRQFVERVFRGAQESMMNTAVAPDAPVGAGAVNVRAMLERGLGSYAFNAASWTGPLASDAAARLDTLVLPIASVSNPAGASGIARLERLVADPAYQLR